MLVYIYTMLSVVMGISALLKGAIYPGIAGIAGPILCWFATSCLKGSLLVGDTKDKLGGLAAGLLFALVGIGIVYHSGYWVGIFSYDFTGVMWCIIGLIAGWVSTTKQHAA